MSRNPRRFAEPVRTIVNFEASTLERIDWLMKNTRHHAHRNRGEFIRLAAEREIRRCLDGLQEP